VAANDCVLRIKALSKSNQMIRRYADYSSIKSNPKPYSPGYRVRNIPQRFQVKMIINDAVDLCYAFTRRKAQFEQHSGIDQSKKDWIQNCETIETNDLQRKKI
jgi:hypothetical protein